MVAGIVVFGIVATIVSSLLLPLSKQSFDPLWQTRAAEVSQSLINEISANAYSRVLLAFGKDEQVISFVQEVHIPNVP